MKVSDLIIDMTTGDASNSDVYMQEAVGQVKIAGAVFEAALVLAESTTAEIEENIEAIQEAGLPTDKKENVALAGKSAKTAVKSLMNATKHGAGSVVSTTDKAMKGFNALMKHYGLGSLTTETSRDLAKKIGEDVKAGKFKAKAGESVFLKGSAAKKIAESYAKGMTCILGACGLAIPSGTAEDPIVKSVIGNACSACAKAKTVTDIRSNLATASKVLSFTAGDAMTGSTSQKAIIDNFNAVYTMNKVAKDIVALGKSTDYLAGVENALNSGDGKVGDAIKSCMALSSVLADKIVEASKEASKYVDNTYSTLKSLN